MTEHTLDSAARRFPDPRNRWQRMTVSEKALVAIAAVVVLSALAVATIWAVGAIGSKLDSEQEQEQIAAAPTCDEIAQEWKADLRADGFVYEPGSIAISTAPPSLELLPGERLCIVRVADNDNLDRVVQIYMCANESGFARAGEADACLGIIRGK